MGALNFPPQQSKETVRRDDVSPGYYVRKNLPCQGVVWQKNLTVSVITARDRRSRGVCSGHGLAPSKRYAPLWPARRKHGGGS